MEGNRVPTFVPIKDSMDKALLAEIAQLKQVNTELEQRYSGHNGSLKEENK